MSALESASTQTINSVPVSILVVDNNPHPIEEARVQAFNARFDLEIDYIHCPAAGVSHARNAGLARANSRYIAFLDDDMEASPQWLERSLHTAGKFDAGIVFSPTIARMPDPKDSRNPYMIPFFFPHRLFCS